jgi:hypothetical protein
MDRALNLGLLAGALDDTLNLPTPTELRSMLANAEVAAFFHQGGRVEDRLLETAWNLHHVGTARPALQLYDPVRQVQANSVAAHIFDLALQYEELTGGERLVLTFAAQVSSIRGDRTPNAAALGRRLPRPSAQLATDPGQASLELGCALLTLDRGATMDLLRRLLAQRPTPDAGTDVAATNGLASALGVVNGVRQLQRYLTGGDAELLFAAREAFVQAANPPSALRDLDSRWVAAHLADLCDDFGTSSVWALLPEGTPPGVGRAMTLGDPPVMTLWPPQVSVLENAAHSPLSAQVTRAVLTFPTSAGKTLLSQLLIAQHLAVVGTGVCFVAPSHSLCREVRDGLDRRLWAMRKFTVEDGPLGDRQAAVAPVVVMTPEKLAARLRSNEQELLEQFGLFVLDEAHLLDDDTRGWTFETTISRLHMLTRDTSHRLFLVSAALGGTASVQTWLDMDATATATTSAWRGPRRLLAAYTPTEDPTTRRTIAATGRQRLPRTVTDLKGVVQLYVDEGEAVATRSALLGQVVRAGKDKTQPTRAAQLAPIVSLAARSGSVLTVHATKISAERLSAELASGRPDRSDVMPLVRLAEQRLGPTHPLVPVLRRGVAYHHAALPTDIQAEIEAAVRAGSIDIVCATTTLTEGVNLPVRTVIVCDRGYYDGEKYNEIIDASDLMNAAGRAGRAGRETEGWVVINYEYGETSPRQALRELEKQHDIRSTLNVDRALEELGEYEALVHETAGLVLTTVPPTVDGFLAYCWYLADVADIINPDDRRERVLQGVRHTLAWHQLPSHIQSRWEALAERVAASYEAAEPTQRSRWARSGIRLSANAVLESVAGGAASAAEALNEFQRANPLAVLEVLLADGRLDQLLSLVPERDYRFKRRRYGLTELVPVDLTALVLDWVSGKSLASLVETHLTGIEAGDDEGYRFEQLSTFLTRICEHHFPWTLGIVLEWINAERTEDLCPQLPLHVHYGAPDAEAIELLLRGVRSRRLAVVVGQRAASDGVAGAELRQWLATLGAPAWRTEFSAGATEVADLLQFVHDPTAGIGGALLDGESVQVAVDPGPGDWGAADELRIRRARAEEEPRPLVVVSLDGEPVATIRAAEYRHLSVLVDAGFELLASPAISTDEGVQEILLRTDLD